MIAAGVLCVPGSDGLLESAQQGMELAKDIKYPVIIKATAGGGGRGMRIIWKKKFSGCIRTTLYTKQLLHGNGAMYMENILKNTTLKFRWWAMHGKTCHLK